jgi:divinyl chlorophyllide a 8-vinyl-reductase
MQVITIFVFLEALLGASALLRHQFASSNRICSTKLCRPSLGLSMSAGIAKDKKRVVIVGATGYIGKFVAKESIRRGHNTVVVVRPSSNPDTALFFEGATVIYGDVTDEQSLRDTVFKDKVDVIISCLASRSGVKEDSYRIDYQATLNALNAGIGAKVEQFILLSAFCVRKPLLQFQIAKLQFEEALIAAQGKGQIAKFSIVRPTAFFKSVSGQFELLQKVNPSAALPMILNHRSMTVRDGHL